MNSLRTSGCQAHRTRSLLRFLCAMPRLPMRRVNTFSLPLPSVLIISVNSNSIDLVWNYSALLLSAINLKRLIADMETYACTSVDASQVCSAWVQTASLPALSVDDAVLLAGAVLTCWAIAAGFRFLLGILIKRY